jgi:glycosyltransferase involved in cell wall biosynthesis
MLDKIDYPKLTIGFLCFNTGKFVAEAVNSVINNNYKNSEYIIIDDCSTDAESVNILRGIVELNPSIELIENKINKGIPANLNEILHRSSGKYLHLIGDDLISETKLYDDVAVFEALDDSYAVVHSIAQTIDQFGKKSPEFSVNLPFPSTFKDLVSIEEMISSPFIHAPTAMFRVIVLKEIGGWDESLLFEDKPMWFKLSKLGKRFKFRPVVSTYYRRHSLNTSYHVRYGFWIYQFQLYALYAQHAEARIELRKLLRHAVGAIDFEECINIYKNSEGKSIILIFVWRILHKIKPFYISRLKGTVFGVLLKRIYHKFL